MKLEAAARRALYNSVSSLLIYVNVFELWTKTSYNTVKKKVKVPFHRIFNPLGWVPISHLSPAAGVIFRGQGTSPTKLINTRFMEADIETPLTSHVGPHVAAARGPSRVGNRGLSFKLPNQESPCARSGLATSLFPGVELDIL